MTKLVLDPTSLPALFPDASILNVYRVRILAQILEYIDEESHLVITKICNIKTPANQQNTVSSTNNCKGIAVNIEGLTNSIGPDTIFKGAIVNINGFWDGSYIEVVQCYPVNSQTLLHYENIETLIEMNNIEGFK
ncbi:uncharacterized protein PRCAT00000357001 [Priceomyces carsonii]|uniref:uncharacterized protein n=1 Tax=Priceomyces carsonii TaxID=28549 RepID=UPI002EDA71B8|nr:unnamed protein product [Priceomyces carsonii]